LTPDVSTGADTLPDDIDALRAALLAERAARHQAEARATGAEAMIAHLKLMIAKLQRDRFGPTSERSRRLLDQLELQLEELEADAAEAEASRPEPTETAGRGTTRAKPVRGPLPAHLPRERVVVPGPTECPCCRGKLAKLGETVTETLEVIPRQWKVIQTVREKFTCRACETITQPPAPFHSIARGRAGPELLAMILEAKFGQHLPLNRQSETYAREAIHLDVSTMGDWVGACTATLAPLVALIRAHLFAAARIHGDDTTVPVLAKGKTITGRLWTYVRDDQPFGGPTPPGAVFHYSRDRGGEHPQGHLEGYAGLLQADAYGGYGKLYEPGRAPGPILEAACWAHGRRKFFVLADIAGSARRAALGKAPGVLSPICLEAVQRIDALFDIERDINGRSAEERRTTRQAVSAPLVAELHQWLGEQRTRLARGNDVARAIDYLLKRWTAFTRFLDDGRICISNNAAERALRGVALGRRAWLFAGSDRGGERAAAMYSLIVTAKLNDVDPRAWLADVLRRIADHPAARLDELLPWNYARQAAKLAA
jgi:transposase